MMRCIATGESLVLTGMDAKGMDLLIDWVYGDFEQRILKPISSAWPSSMPATDSTSLSCSQNVKGHSEALSASRRSWCWQIWLQHTTAESLSRWVALSILCWCMYTCYFCANTLLRVSSMGCFWHDAAILLKYITYLMDTSPSIS